jgi:hypothetical protein
MIHVPLRNGALLPTPLFKVASAPVDHGFQGLASQSFPCAVPDLEALTNSGGYCSWSNATVKSARAAPSSRLLVDSTLYPDLTTFTAYPR